MPRAVIDIDQPPQAGCALRVEGKPLGPEPQDGKHRLADLYAQTRLAGAVALARGVKTFTNF